MPGDGPDFVALRADIDALPLPDSKQVSYASQNPEQLKVVGETFSEEPYGVGVPKNDPALRNKINDLLQAAIDDGTWRTIYDGTLGKSGTPADPPQIERY